MPLRLLSTERQNALRRAFFRLQDRLALSASESRALLTIVTFAICGMLMQEYRLRHLPEPMEPLTTSTPPVNDEVTASGGYTGPEYAEPQTPSPLLVDSASVTMELPKPVREKPQSTININTASLADLQKLPGIGPAMAQRIADYRSAAGGFVTIEELSAVKGIGPKRLQKLVPRVRLKN